ncbi:Retrovirus-related Pol polyprotein from transposon 17.6, partial [Clarias magur]
MVHYHIVCHLGAHCMLKKLGNFYWPGMETNACNVCQHCPKCQHGAHTSSTHPT